MSNDTDKARVGSVLLLLLAGVIWAPGCGDESDVGSLLDVRAPAAVASLQAFPADQKVRLTWSPAPEKDVLGYNIYRAAAADGTFNLVGSTGIQQAPFFQDEGDDLNGDLVPDGLTNQLTFFYKVTAFDREGRETPLNLAAAVSATPGVQPGALQDLFVTNVRAYGGDQRVIITWDLNPNAQVFGYFVYRQELGAPTGFQVAALVAQGRGFFIDAGMANGSEFVYAIAPVTRDLFEGRRVESRAVRTDPGDFTVPKPPGSDQVAGALTLLSVGASGVTIRWGRPTENTDGSLLLPPALDDLVGGGFIVFRSLTPEGDFEPIGILENVGSETTFTYTDPRGSDLHFYMVRAFDRLGTLSDDSRHLGVGGTIVPDVIRGVDAFASTSFGTISVSWDLDPTAVSGYRVFRSTRRDRGYVQISGNLPPTQNFFQDGIALLQTGQTFFYRVAGLSQLPSGEIIQGALSDPVPAVAGPSDGVFYLAAEDATVISITAGAFAQVTRQAFPFPFDNLGTLFLRMAPGAIPNGAVTFLELEWFEEIDATGPTGTPRAYDVLLRTIRNANSGIFDVRVQDFFTGATAQRNGVDFFTDDFGFPPRQSNLFLGQIVVVDADTVGGNPVRERIRLRLSYEGFNPAVAAGNGELFVDGLVLVRR